jgi:hypothetical protein
MINIHSFRRLAAVIFLVLIPNESRTEELASTTTQSLIACEEHLDAFENLYDSAIDRRFSESLAKKLRFESAGATFVAVVTRNSKLGIVCDAQGPERRVLVPDESKLDTKAIELEHLNASVSWTTWSQKTEIELALDEVMIDLWRAQRALILHFEAKIARITLRECASNPRPSKCQP